MAEEQGLVAELRAAARTSYDTDIWAIAANMAQPYEARRIAAESALADLQVTLLCGHRKADCADSYGGCAACSVRLALSDAEAALEVAEARVKQLEEALRSIIEYLRNGRGGLSRVLVMAQEALRHEL